MSMEIQAELALQEAMEGFEWIEAIHQAVIETHDPDDFFELQRWWIETVEGVWKDWIASQRSKV